MRNHVPGLVGRQTVVFSAQNNAGRWIREGAQMAKRDPDGVEDSIEVLHGAESASHTVLADRLKARGRIVLEERADLQKSLEAAGFNPSQHLSEQVQGRVDLAIASALAFLNVALSMFVFLGFGPLWLAPTLALLVLLTAGAVEEFFNAYDRRSTFGEAFFLAISVVALLAQFWLGSIRGLLVGALTPMDVGPITHALTVAAPILRWGLGVLAVIAEVLCGYKFYRARQQLCSPSQRGVRARDACDRELVALHGAIKSYEAEPGMRRGLRAIGARQYLSLASRADVLKGRRHLARAATGAAIALLVLAFLVLGVASSFGAEVKPERPVVVLLDLTKSSSPESFSANCRTVGAILKTLQRGDRLIVLGITDDFGRVPVLLDRRLPKPGYMGLQIGAARETLASQWQKIATTLQPVYTRTDVIGALRFISFMELPGTSMKLIVLSDLRQSSGELDLESPSRIAVPQALGVVRRSGHFPVLQGVEVFLLGVDPTNKTAAYMAALKEFWMELFSSAGARVRVFSFLREVPELGTH
jgi:hypothetical protein